MFENPLLALGARPQTLLACEVHGLLIALLVLALISEVKLQLLLLIEFDDGGKRPALLAPKTLKWPHTSLVENGLHFLGLKLPP